MAAAVNSSQLIFVSQDKKGNAQNDALPAGYLDTIHGAAA
jgi:hypothetical protein